jgi:mRNA interferase HicA
MKRRDLVRYLLQNGCRLVREGVRHSWWENAALNKRTAVPRHTEIVDLLARKICKDLGLEPPKSS